MSSSMITDYIGSGLAAARPATPNIAAGSTAMWFSTDTNTLSVYGGGLWTDIAGGGGGGDSVDIFDIPAAATFPTIINGGSASPAPSVTDQTYGMVFDSSVTQGGDRIRAAMQAIPHATTFTLTVGVRITMAAINFRSCGLFLTDGTKFIGIHQQSSIVQVTRYTNLTTFSVNSAAMATTSRAQWYFRIQGDGTNLIFSFSQDGRNFVELYRELVGAFMGGLTLCGIGGNANASTTPPVAGDHIFGTVFYWKATTP